MNRAYGLPSLPRITPFGSFLGGPVAVGPVKVGFPFSSLSRVSSAIFPCEYAQAQGGWEVERKFSRAPDM